VKVLRSNGVQTSTICWSTSFVRKIGEWDHNLIGFEDIELAIRGFLSHARVLFTNDPAWIVWNHHFSSERVSQGWNTRNVLGNVHGYKKLVTLMENANCDSETMTVLFQECTKLARVFYLNGFVDEALELFSIAWARSYATYPGPWWEQALAAGIGVRPALASRSFIGRIKRAAFKGLGAEQGRQFGRGYAFWKDWVGIS
jgi:hypothetical protein